MRVIKEEAIILKRVNSGEADRLLTILTRSFGKIQVKASGVRKITSRRCAHLEPLNKVLLTLYQGKSMPIVTEAETLEDFSFLKTKLKAIGYAYYLCELVDRLTPEGQEHASVVSLLNDALQTLNQEDVDASFLEIFEMALLQTLGYLQKSLQHRTVNTQFLIEQIIERKLKTKQILPKLLE